MTKCPRCFVPIGSDVYCWVCRTGQCAQVDDPAASRVTGSPVKSGTVVTVRRDPAVRNWRPPASADCPRCHVPAGEACPTCHYALPPGYRDGRAVCVAMSGARSTGKSLYIAVAIAQLEEMAVNLLRTTVRYADAATRDVYESTYRKPLYELRGLMLPTPEGKTSNAYQKTPLIFDLGAANGEARRYFVIRDVAGEDMERATPADTHLEFLQFADAVFFLFDPLAVAEVADKLKDLVPQSQTGGEPRVVLDNLLNLMRTRKPRTAVIVSKSDALHELRKVDDVKWKAIMANTGAAFMRDPSMATGWYDSADGELLHEEIRSLLHMLGGSQVVLRLENEADWDYRFFAVSALGDSPAGQEVNRRGIAPIRVLDPVKWAFSAAGFLPPRP